MEYIFFDRKAILDFLRQYGKGPDSKDYEFLTALLLSKFCESQGITPNLIGFELKSGAESLPDPKQLTLDEVNKVLRESVESNTPVDVAIVQGTHAKREPQGHGFQLKRFGRDPAQKGSTELIEFINGLKKKFGKTEAALVLILDPGLAIDIKQVINGIQTDDFPFSRIMFMAMTDNQLLIGEFWPNEGFTKYDSKDFLNEDNV